MFTINFWWSIRKGHIVEEISETSNGDGYFADALWHRAWSWHRDCTLPRRHYCVYCTLAYVYIGIFVTYCVTSMWIHHVMSTCIMLLPTKRPFSLPSDPSTPLQMSLFLLVHFSSFSSEMPQTHRATHTDTHPSWVSWGSPVSQWALCYCLLPDHMASLSEQL